MYEREWKEQQEKDYLKNKEQVSSIQKCIGNESDYLTYTYLSIYNAEEQKTYTYFLFCPFITGYERQWEDTATRPWDRNYNFSIYKNIPYVFAKDDYIYCSKEFLKQIHDRKRDILILQYDNWTLKEIEIVYTSATKPIISSIEYIGEPTNTSFLDWYKNKKSLCNVVLKLRNPYERFSAKDIVIQNGKHTLFDISFI